LTSTQEQNAADGLKQYWSQVFANLDVNVNFDISNLDNYENARIVFFVDQALAGTSSLATAHMQPDGSGSIGVSPTALSNGTDPNFWRWLGAHETGHLMDMMDMYTSGCLGMTMMYEHLPYNPGSLPAPTCSDIAGSNAKWYPESWNPCNYGCPGGYTSTCLGDQQPDPAVCNCCIDYSPIIIDTNGDGFHLSGTDDGVIFATSPEGPVVKMGWPVSGGDAWLALDRNGNGWIDDGSELFGNRTPMANGTPALNGFTALAEYDMNGDHWIDAQDPIFSRLVLWRDSNRNGKSEPAELTPAASFLLRLSVDYRESRRRDAFGNWFRFAGKALTATGPRQVYDVYPVTTGCSRKPTISQ
jgi:hypothetical protein